MDAAILSAASALAGSMIGAASSVMTTWLTQRGQARAQVRSQQIAKRELLYTEFISEVAERLTDGLSRNAESLAVVVRLYASVGKMRLISSREVVTAAEALVNLVIQIYAGPNQTFDELRAVALGAESDPMVAFGEACRTELAAMQN